MKLTHEQAEALVRLRNHKEFSVFLQMLSEYAEDKNKCLIMRDDVNIDVLRGELRMLATLERAITDAPVKLGQFTEEHV